MWTLYFLSQLSVLSCFSKSSCTKPRLKRSYFKIHNRPISGWLDFLNHSEGHFVIKSLQRNWSWNKLSVSYSKWDYLNSRFTLVVVVVIVEIPNDEVASLGPHRLSGHRRTNNLAIQHVCQSRLLIIGSDEGKNKSYNQRRQLIRWRTDFSINKKLGIREVNRTWIGDHHQNWVRRK